MTFDQDRWPNFTQQELSCRCGCGTFICEEDSLDRLQALRNALGKPVVVRSASRCEKHNAAEGGARHSQHLLGKAFDIETEGHDPAVMFHEAERAGFHGFGLGRDFLHVDTGPARRWDYGAASREAWRGVT